MSFKTFIDSVAGQNKRTGGGDFLKLSDGANVFRLFEFTDSETGEKEPGLTFYQHWVDNRPSICKAKTFNDGSTCPICHEVELLRDQDKERANRMCSAPSAWLAAVPQGSTTCGILAVTGATMSKILHAVAQAGGWSGDEDWKDPEFVECMNKGVDDCFGPTARDVIITVAKNAAPKDKYKVRLSTNKGRNLGDIVVPDLRAAFARVKGLDGSKVDTGPTKGKASVRKVVKPAAKKVVKKATPKAKK